MGIEEYIVSKTAFGFDSVDLCEIARNSVLTSTFDHSAKVRMLGECYMHPNAMMANDKDRTNISDIRVAYRSVCLLRELASVCERAGLAKNDQGDWILGGRRVPDATEVFYKASAAMEAYEALLLDGT